MLDPKHRDGLAPGDAKFLEIIDKFQWHVMSVAPRIDEEGESFSYSTGLFMRFKRPEVILFGLDPDTSQHIINDVGKLVEAGNSYELDRDYAGIFAHEVKCRFRPVLPAHYKEYVNWSLWFYEQEQFPLVQCFWPDKNGHYPWEKECHPEVATCQPLLYLQPRSVM
jgi:hypothetical protein